MRTREESHALPFVSEENEFQALWACRRCHAAGLLAESHRYCPHCGTRRAAERAFFPDWDDLVSVSTHRYHGVAVPCCGQVWSTRAAFCGACGHRLQAGSPADVDTLALEDLHNHKELTDALFDALGEGLGDGTLFDGDLALAV